MTRVRCRDCRYFKAKEFEVSTLYTDPEKARERQEQEKTGKPVWPCNVLQADSLHGIPMPISMCHHADCFKWETEETPENGERMVKERMAGQAQLNPKGRCAQYQRKWWKFWAPDRAR